MADISDELIKLGRSAEEERAKLTGLDGEAFEAQWEWWREAAAVVQAAVTAAEPGTSRVELEMMVKKAVRHAAAARPSIRR